MRKCKTPQDVIRLVHRLQDRIDEVQASKPRSKTKHVPKSFRFDVALLREIEGELFNGSGKLVAFGSPPRRRHW